MGTPFGQTLPTGSVEGESEFAGSDVIRTIPSSGAGDCPSMYTAKETWASRADTRIAVIRRAIVQ
jgi:hypothetical protein